MNRIILLVFLANSYLINAQYSFTLSHSVVAPEGGVLCLAKDGFMQLNAVDSTVKYLDGDLRVLGSVIMPEGFKHINYVESDGHEIFAGKGGDLIDGDLVEFKLKNFSGFYNVANGNHFINGDRIYVPRKPGVSIDKYSASDKARAKEFENDNYLTVYDFKGKILDTFIHQDSMVLLDRGLTWAWFTKPRIHCIPELEIICSNSIISPTISVYSLEGELVREFGVWPKESDQNPRKIKSSSEFTIMGARGFIESDLFSQIEYDAEEEVLFRFFTYAMEDTVSLDEQFLSYVLEDSKVRNRERSCPKPNPMVKKQSEILMGAHKHIQVFDPVSGVLLDEFKPEYNAGGKRYLGKNKDGYYVYSHEEEVGVVLDFVEFTKGRGGTSRAE